MRLFCKFRLVIISFMMIFITIGEIRADEITKKLINPKATKEAVELYNYLLEGYGKRTLSAAMCRYTIKSDETEWIKEQSGKYPAILCYDMMNATATKPHDDYNDMVVSAKRWSRDGGIVAVMWHWRDPLKRNDAFYSMKMGKTSKAKTDFDVSKVHDPKSKEYRAMIDDIDIVAKYLLKLQKLNIPVLWRPLHEAQGGWFWWGAARAEDNIALWNLLYDRLVNHHGLNNLIWVWTVDKIEGADGWYPGDDIVDILGIDIYDTPSHDSRREYFDFTADIAKGTKMVTLSECGSIPHPDNMITGGDKWLWFMPWLDQFLHDEKYLKVETLKEIMNSDFVITRDEVKLKK